MIDIPDYRCQQATMCASEQGTSLTEILLRALEHELVLRAREANPERLSFHDQRDFAPASQPP